MIVFTLKDIIGLSLLGIAGLIFVCAFLYAFAKNLITKIKNKFKKKIWWIYSFIESWGELIWKYLLKI